MQYDSERRFPQLRHQEIQQMSIVNPLQRRRSVKAASFRISRLSLYLHVVIFLAVTCISSFCNARSSSYSNFTLASLDGALSVVVYLPNGLKPDEETFYYSSRFDHGSMIGSIHYQGRVLFDASTWRQPHNINWPESAIGLASEFGVGDDGAFCFFQCGWQGATDVTNGVLGYQEAKLGESFLKIGVGELIKGTCPICDSAEDYRFNSPYLFAKEPEWKITGMSDSQVKLEHQALMTNKDHVQYGYKLGKNIQLQGNVLEITSTLSNLGQQPFSTAWYSHNFFTCDGLGVGPGYEASLDLQAIRDQPLYEEPGTWSWSTPIHQYAHVKSRLGSVYVNMTREVEPGVRIKTDFVNDGQTKGGFMLRACDTQITSTLHTGENLREQMYAYGLYIERGTFSPEPQILIHLEPGQSKSWTQRLRIEKDDHSDIGSGDEGHSTNLWQMFLRREDTDSLSSLDSSPLSQYMVGGMCMLLSAYAVMFLLRRVSCRQAALRGRYTAIADTEPSSTLQ